jgi:hypothetical protein
MLTQHKRRLHPKLNHPLLKKQKWILARLEEMIGINHIKERTGLNFSHLMMNQRAQGMRSLTWLPVHGLTMMNHWRIVGQSQTLRAHLLPMIRRKTNKRLSTGSRTLPSKIQPCLQLIVSTIYGKQSRTSPYYFIQKQVMIVSILGNSSNKNFIAFQ